jgi:hypothetical protein
MTREKRIFLSMTTALVATPLALLTVLMLALLIIVVIKPVESHHVFSDPAVLWNTLILILSTGVPAAALIWFSRWIVCDYSIDRGACSNCGYDLRGSKDRCAECGKIIARAATSTSESKGGHNSSLS